MNRLHTGDTQTKPIQAKPNQPKPIPKTEGVKELGGDVESSSHLMRFLFNKFFHDWLSVFLCRFCGPLSPYRSSFSERSRRRHPKPQASPPGPFY